MQDLPRFRDPNLLLGAEHFSDAGVYRIDGRTAIVQSIDFFPPLVDDPYEFGRIAAANAVSDVYAIGAAVRTALNVVAFPDDQLDLAVLSEILRGGAERVEAAGGVILGGHSVRDVEIKYGLAVTGVVDPERMMTNARAAEGDALVLTKALGTGFITTAHRGERCPDDVLAAAYASMVQLNLAAAEAATALGARAATDITGFGLAGHAVEMARASGVAIHLDLGRLPFLPGALELARAGNNRTRANGTNRAHVEPTLRLECAPDDDRLELLFDPQTSGGLLVAIDPRHADDLVARCRAGGAEAAVIVGEVGRVQGAHLVVHP